LQTFLPYSDFAKVALCLDWRRLGKQRVEAKQILDILSGKGKINKYGKISWINHPAVRMWRGYEECLTYYMNIMIMTWISKGYKNNMPLLFTGDVVYPPWMGNERVHSSHRANLLRKNYLHYRSFGWQEKPLKGYFWPIKLIG
jgi:hypothetical protein